MISRSVGMCRVGATCLSCFSTTGHGVLMMLDMEWEMMVVGGKEMMGDGGPYIPSCSHHV